MTPRHDAGKWSLIRSAFDEVIDLDEGRRTVRLDQIGATDPELRRAVDELLACDRDADTRLAHLDAVFSTAAAAEEEARPQASDPLQLVGQTMSHFRILDTLGRGGMGVVYCAEDTRLQRRVALKFPLSQHFIDREAKQRFLHEARSAAALDHPNLCSIFEVGETAQGHPFIAMPLYDGETLKARLERAGALPPDAAVRIAQQIASGLAAAHAAGIVHRDLKPANIMLLRDGSVKVLDFGLAKIADLSFTATHARLGTAAYMAPEQVLGRPVDGRTDLWALGVLLFEMLTARRPFEREHDVAVAHAIAHDEPTAPSSVRADSPAACERLIRALLQKDPRDRPPTAHAVEIALRDLSVANFHSAGSGLRHVFAGARRSTRVKAAIAVVLLLVLAAAARWLRRDGTGAPGGVQTMAVFPFVGAGDVDEVARGLSDDVTDLLATLASLNVFGRTSVRGLTPGSDADRNALAEVGARGLLTGSVRAVNGRLMLDARLVEPRSSRVIWSEHYTVSESELTETRADIALSVARALRATMTAAERSRLTRGSTVSGEAFVLYLRGRARETHAEASKTLTGTLEELGNAQSAYSRALVLDPSFALARARLALTHGWVNSVRRNDEARREQSRLEAEAALRLDADLPDARIALARYWQRRGDNERALEEYRSALNGYPNAAALHVNIGSLYRTLGRWEDAIAEYEQAMQLNPRDPLPAAGAAITYGRLRRFAEAIAAWDRALGLAPDDYLGQTIRGHVYLRWQGQADTLAAIVKRIPVTWDDGGILTHAAVTAARVQRRPAEALAALNASRIEVTHDQLMYRPKPLVRAQIYIELGDTVRAREEFHAADVFLVDSVTAHPNDARMRISLGLARAGLGRKAEAIADARRALELSPVSRNSLDATAILAGAAEIFTSVGDFDAAFEMLDLLLTMPAGREVSVPFLRADPTWDPLRRDPRFDRLLQRFSSS